MWDLRCGLVHSDVPGTAVPHVDLLRLSGGGGPLPLPEPPSLVPAAARRRSANGEFHLLNAASVGLILPRRENQIHEHA